MTMLEAVDWSGKIFTGSWTPAQGSGTLTSIEPATGQTLAEVGLAGKDDVAASAKQARAAQPAWAATPGHERAALIRNVARVLEDNRAEFETWLVREGGAVPGKAAFEGGLVLGELWEAAALPTQPWGHLLATAEPGRESIAQRLPLGVVGVISPWNFPQILSVRAVAPALALGNAVILKPDVHTAVSGGVLIARLFEEAGLPAGLLHVLPGDAEAGSALALDPNVAMISFTGSTAVGREGGAAAGRTLKRVSLELGGNNALIVLDDADLDVAASSGAWSAFLHQGQICMTAGRPIVLESVADQYLERLADHAAKLPVGDPNTEQVALGPLISERQLANVDRIVTSTVSAGAQLCAGGTHDRLYYTPTVLGGVTQEMPAFREEIFGPVAPVTVVKNDTEAIAVANDTEYGLVAAIQTGSRDRGRAMADQLDTGIVHVNDQTLNNDAYARSAAPVPRATAPGSGRKGAGTSSPSGAGSPSATRRTASRSDQAPQRRTRRSSQLVLNSGLRVSAACCTARRSRSLPRRNSSSLRARMVVSARRKVNAWQVCSSEGKVSAVRAVSGKNSQGKVCAASVLPGNPWRISTGAPGRRTPRTSRAAASRSAMWWITRDSQAPSAEPSGSGRVLASPSSAWMPGRRGIWARIAADGSTARMLRPNQSLKAAANAPVPAPMSATVIPGNGLR